MRTPHSDNPVSITREALPEGGSLRVLVVDDDIVDFEAMQRSLKRMETYQIEAVWAKNPEVARYRLATDKFDVVFVDYHLGLNTGSALMQEIGGRESRHVLILISGMISRHVQHMALMAGAIHCMSKDEIDPRSLEKAIRYALYTHALEQRLYTQLIGHKLNQHSLEQKMIQLARELEEKGESLMRSAHLIEQTLQFDEKSSSVLRQVSNIRETGRELKERARNMVCCLTGEHEADLAGKRAEAPTDAVADVVRLDARRRDPERS